MPLIHAVVVLGTLQASEAIAQSLPMLKTGRAIAERKCARCHPMGGADERPHAIVTPFREPHTRYRIEMLVDARASGVISGLDEMHRKRRPLQCILFAGR